MFALTGHSIIKIFMVTFEALSALGSGLGKIAFRFNTEKLHSDFRYNMFIDI